MSQRILITGSAGLIGCALRAALAGRGFRVSGFDIRSEGMDSGDVRIPGQIDQALEACDGVVHLAAVSRVIWGEREPALCLETNVNGTRNVLEAARRRNPSPWLIFASSREVYGQPADLPVREDAPLRPVNLYGKSKHEGERMVEAARMGGLCASVIRLSNVYGSVGDHPDRVVPAFARAAVLGQPLRVEGPEQIFDFNHVDDVVAGISSLVGQMSTRREATPPIQFVSGIPTSLRELARMAIRIAGSGSAIHLAPSRKYDVARFYGTAERAEHLLNWKTGVPLEEGLTRLVGDFQRILVDPKRELRVPGDPILARPSCLNPDPL